VGPEERILNSILRVLTIAHQPTRKIVRSIEVRQHLPREILVRPLIEQGIRPIRLTSAARLCGRRIYSRLGAEFPLTLF
jgi:hypothetical protein